MSETITDFLLARIAEDERIAQRMIDELEDQIEAGGFTGLDANGPFTATRMLSAQLWAYYDGQTRWRNFARGQYLARVGDPARVLAECAAKRTIVRAHASITVWPDGTGGMKYYVGGKQVCASCDERTQAPCPTARTLAAVYSDHPDYQQEWAL